VRTRFATLVCAAALALAAGCSDSQPTVGDAATPAAAEAPRVSRVVLDEPVTQCKGYAGSLLGPATDVISFCAASVEACESPSSVELAADRAICAKRFGDVCGGRDALCDNDQRCKPGSAYARGGARDVVDCQLLPPGNDDDCPGEPQRCVCSYRIHTRVDCVCAGCEQR